MADRACGAKPCPSGMRMILDLHAAAVVVVAERQDVDGADRATPAGGERALRAAGRTASARLPRTAPSAATLPSPAPCSAVKPGSTCCSCHRLRINRPAPTSSTIDIATSATINSSRAPRPIAGALLLAAFFQRVVEIAASTGAAPAAGRTPRWSTTPPRPRTPARRRSMPI